MSSPCESSRHRHPSQGVRRRPSLSASTTKRLSTSTTRCARLKSPCFFRQHLTSSNANIFLPLTNCHEITRSLRTRPMASIPRRPMDSTTRQMRRRSLVTQKCRALYLGPFWDVHDHPNQFLISAHRSGLLSSCVARPCAFAIAANMEVGPARRWAVDNRQTQSFPCNFLSPGTVKCTIL